MALTACAGSGSINWDNVRQLRIGMTKVEVEQKMDKPYSVAAKADGSDVWIRVHAHGMTGGTQSASVIFKNGIASSVPVVPDSFK